VLDWLPLPVCVASSSSPEPIRHKLQLTDLLRCFGENLFSATMVARGKPAPDLFLYAARRLTTAPDHVSSSRTALRVLLPQSPPARPRSAFPREVIAGRSTERACSHAGRRWSLPTCASWRPLSRNSVKSRQGGAAHRRRRFRRFDAARQVAGTFEKSSLRPSALSGVR